MPIPGDTIRKGFEKAAKAGAIDDSKVESLIRSVRRGRVTKSEADEFKAQAARFQDQFTPTAKQKITDFIEHKMPTLQVFDPGTPLVNPGGLKDPKVLPADVDRVRQQRIEGGQLFRKGVSGDDPRQNLLGDCYLIAAMSAVAKQQPDAIAKRFTENADGTFTVTLYEYKGRALVPRPVTIDADLPRNDWLGNRYAYARDEKELWPALLEKAFAARAGSYAKLEHGAPADAMEALTGLPSVELELRGAGVTPASVFAAIKAGVDAGKPGVAVTYAESSAAKYTNTGVFADHAYALWGTSEKGGKQYVELRNPWGDTEPAGNGADDGVFKLELSEFLRLFYNVSFNG